MKQYEKYKSSGFDWMGEIPEHWIVDKFNRIAFYQEGPGLRNWQFKEDGVKVICVTNITEDGIDFSLLNRCISQTEYDKTYKHFTVQKGDYLLASSGASWGKLAEYLEDEKVILNTSTIRLNTEDGEKVVREFIKWIIKSPYVTEQLNILLTGSCQPNFGPTHLSQLTIIYPSSTEEQIAIANFLDEKTTQIDKLISNKQKLIELLKEERAAIINEAVSGKGKNWERKKLKYVADVNSSKGNFVFEKNSDSEVVFLPMEKVSESGMTNQEARKKINEVSTGFTYFERGDVIVAKITPCFENGKGALLENLETDFGFGSTEFHTLRASGKITREFLFYQTKTDKFMQVGEAFMTGSAGQKRVPTSFVQDFEIAMPPIQEQTVIVHHIQTETQRIDNTISKIEKEIELMNEYRIALISEAVTGKIKVTND